MITKKYINKKFYIINCTLTKKDKEKKGDRAKFMNSYSKKANFFYLRLVLILGINSILPKGWGIKREKSIVSIADKDIYIFTA